MDALLNPPLPPIEYRRLVGPTDERDWLNESGAFFIDRLPLLHTREEMLAVQDRVLDFGCGAGRIAIKMLMQKVRPNRFVGVDVSQKMIEWCRQNLSVYDSNFTFYHHDVFSPVYAPDNSHNDIAPLPAEDAAFSLLVSHSVFSHLYEFQARHYLSELARVLEPGGLIYSTWFFFNRAAIRPLAAHQNCLFINEHDPSQAVYYDWTLFRNIVRERGLRVVWVDWTLVPGGQTVVFLQKGNGFPDIGDRLVPPRTVVGY